MTKLKKNLILLILFLFFSSCGYTPIFSKKDVNFSIENIEFFGDRFVKKRINHTLSVYKNKSDKEKKISLVITSLKNITIASKNSKGEIQTNRISIDVNVKIILPKNSIVEKNFSKSSIYDVVDRKSEQKLIENKLIENLSSTIAQQVILEILKNTK
jgi:hypothetical protein|tara:strand:+ start:1273 stop:1743 length:471 start_codon:yes stop_codon:yes gene_type:complete